jgi:hypothetical protein
MWMWIHGSFQELDSYHYGPTLAKFVDEDGMPNLEIMKRAYNPEERERLFPGPISEEMMCIPIYLLSND